MVQKRNARVQKTKNNKRSGVQKKIIIIIEELLVNGFRCICGLQREATRTIVQEMIESEQLVKGSEK